jgi:DNA-binding IclR family transcriptional regulator
VVKKFESFSEICSIFFMVGSQIERVLSIFELLAHERGGAGLTVIADRTRMPNSAVHRLLGDLARLGYVRQDADTARYLLTTKLLSLGFAYLSASGADAAQPVLDRLAHESGELVRLAVVDRERLTWVAKAQGARSGLRYDPEMGAEPALFCTASGHSWLATLEDETAIAIAARQGFGHLDDHGPNAPRTITVLKEALQRTRAQGYAVVHESAVAGTSAMAAAVLHPSKHRAIGTISVAGPSFRMTPARIVQLAPSLLAGAAELSRASIGSEFLSDSARSNVSATRRAKR